jgi:hypothetical protein
MELKDIVFILNSFIPDSLKNPLHGVESYVLYVFYVFVSKF